MKKALALILAAVMAVGSAIPASAASQIDFSGYHPHPGRWIKDHASTGLMNFLGYFDVYYIYPGRQPSDLASYSISIADSFILNIDMIFQPADEFPVLWRLRTPDVKHFGNTAWGSNRAPIIRFRSVFPTVAGKTQYEGGQRSVYFPSPWAK